MTDAVNRKSPSDSTRSQVGLVLLIVLVCTGLITAIGYGDEIPARHSREPNAGVKLPPRSGSHDSDGPSSRKGAGNSTAGGLWTTVISLVAIVGCLGLVGYWLRPYLGVPRGLPIDALELLGRRVIEQKVAIHLVRCGSRVLVLGVSPDGARTLSEITDPAEVRRLVDACHMPRDPRPNTPLITPPDMLGGIPSAGGMDGFSTSAAGQRTSSQRGPSYQTEDPRRG